MWVIGVWLRYLDSFSVGFAAFKSRFFPICLRRGQPATFRRESLRGLGPYMAWWLRLAEGRRGRALEDEATARLMDEAEPRGVQTDAPERIAPTAVGAIADDRVAEPGELRADLTAPPRDQRQLEQRRVAVTLEHAVARDGLAYYFDHVEEIDLGMERELEAIVSREYPPGKS